MSCKKPNWNWIFIFVPFLIVGWCCHFFNYAFDRTMALCDKEVPTVQFSIAQDCSSNAVLKLVSGDAIIAKIASSALTNREQIVKKEHDRFRAELTTWLSIFGLLTILVALITPIFSIVFQQKEFERLQILIDSQATAIQEVKAQQEELRRKHEEVTQAAEKVSNDIDSNDANFIEYTPSDMPNGLRNLLNQFKNIWGKDRIEEKIAAGIRLFNECDEKIGDAMAGDDYVGIRNCLNILNNANAYLGMRNLDEFREVFIRQMLLIRPLKHSNEEIITALEKGGIDGPIRGFYQKALSLQGGIPG